MANDIVQSLDFVLLGSPILIMEPMCPCVKYCKIKGLIALSLLKYLLSSIRMKKEINIQVHLKTIMRTCVMFSPAIFSGVTTFSVESQQ